MCLILVKPANVKLPQGLFENLTKRNKDGFGLMFKDKNNNLIHKKTPSGNWKDHYELFEPYQDQHVGLHWRMKTQGDVIHDNTHPFEVVENKLLLMHNGSISEVKAEDDKSDTWTFVNKVLQPSLNALKDPLAIVQNDLLKKFISTYVGSHNKLLMLGQDKFHYFNQFFITDDDYVEEMRGLIFSNIYAWDNQFWYKTAHQNEFNKEYITNTKTFSPREPELYNYYKRTHYPEPPKETKRHATKEKVKVKRDSRKTILSLKLKNENQKFLATQLTLATIHFQDKKETASPAETKVSNVTPTQPSLLH